MVLLPCLVKSCQWNKLEEGAELVQIGGTLHNQTGDRASHLPQRNTQVAQAGTHLRDWIIA